MPALRNMKATSRSTRRARSNPSKSSAGSRVQQSTSSQRAVTATSSSQRGHVAAARQEASPELPEYTPKFVRDMQGKGKKKATDTEAAIINRPAQALPTPGASSSASQVRNGTPEDVKPVLRPVIDLTGADERSSRSF